VARLAIYTESRGVDLAAVTAFETLRGPLGYEGLLERLGRADLWCVATRPGCDLAKLTGDLIHGTSVFVNPNKHRWSVWREDGNAADSIECGAWVLVWDADETEGKRAAAELRGAGFGDKVEEVWKATLWALFFTPAAAGKEAGLAADIAVARERRSGLLANPHTNRCAWGAAPAALAGLVARFGGRA